MKEILEKCCGIDVHRDSMTACIMIGFGKTMKKEIKTFGTMTKDIEGLCDWLESNDIVETAIESTGIYWKPVFNIGERRGLNISLANARNVKNVPGRKTDVKDAEWLCKLLKNGLIEKSFIPPEGIRFLRELTRYKRSLNQDLTSAKNRIIKILESHNVKIASVFSNVFGIASWKILEQIAQGEQNLDLLTENLSKNIKAPRSKIKEALKNTLKEENRTMLKVMMKHVLELEELISQIEKQITDKLSSYESTAKQLEKIPGISLNAAATIIAEIGTDMKQFPTASHLTSWAGMSPGNNESAGKKKVHI